MLCNTHHLCYVAILGQANLWKDRGMEVWQTILWEYPSSKKPSFAACRSARKCGMILSWKDSCTLSFSIFIPLSIAIIISRKSGRWSSAYDLHHEIFTSIGYDYFFPIHLHSYIMNYIFVCECGIGQHIILVASIGVKWIGLSQNGLVDQSSLQVEVWPLSDLF